MSVQIREGWALGFGSVLGAAAAIIGLLMLIGVAPDNTVDVGASLVLLGIARIVP